MATDFPTQKLTPDQRFFFDHAGTSWNPAAETAQQGKTRGAIEMAADEALYLQAHRVADVACVWSDDPEPYEMGDAETKAPSTVEICAIECGGEILACLCSIGDADANYRRVIRAELASECADRLREIIAQAS